MYSLYSIGSKITYAKIVFRSKTSVLLHGAEVNIRC